MRGIVVLLAAVILATGVSAVVLVEHWSAPDAAVPYGLVDTAVTLDIEDLDPDAELTVAFVIPELNVRVIKGPYDPATVQRTTVKRILELPFDAETGTYVLRMSVIDDDGNRRIKHRFVEIG